MARKTTSTTKPKKSAPHKTRTVRREALAPKQGKPVFRAGTWIAILLLAVLIGATYYLNNKKETAETEITATSEPAFIFGADGTVSSIEVKPSAGESVKVSRNEENVWAIILPFETEADQGSVEAAASQITALRIIDEVDADPSIFGFDTPAYFITIGFADGTTQTLEIGDSTPTNSGYYVRVDNDKMVIVGLSSIDALTSLVFFPPYLNTPTPTALPATPTPDSPTETRGASTPEATVTPTP